MLALKRKYKIKYFAINDAQTSGFALGKIAPRL